MDNRRLELVRGLAIPWVQLEDHLPVSNSSVDEEELPQVEDAAWDGAPLKDAVPLAKSWAQLCAPTPVAARLPIHSLQTLYPSPRQASNHPRAHVTSQHEVPIMSRDHV